METIAVVDTSICTDNLGDEIIMDAVNSVIWELFPKAYIFRVPSHEALSDRTRGFIDKADYCFVGGTNILSSDISTNGLWRIVSADADQYAQTNTVCLGVGWNDYMQPPSPETDALLRRLLSPRLTHSVRDSYTRGHLSTVGVQAVTTSCPTTWALTPEHCAQIPARKSDAVVLTMSAWRPDPDADRAFVEAARRHYRHVYFFPQMQDDWAYFEQFGWSDIKMVEPTAEGYTKFLQNEDVDFIGTRLHGGIRAMQTKRRALILAIDNRAAEISRDTGLPVVARGDLAAIEAWIIAAAPTQLSLPQAQISAWKAQFSPGARLDRPDRSQPLYAERQASLVGKLARKIAARVP